jgi:phage head maturation protease
VIGYTRTGSLQLEITKEGFDYTINVARTRAGDDAIELVRSGLAPFTSFGFHCFDESWSYDDGMPLRHLITGALTEVSIVSNSCYLDSTAAEKSEPPR